MDYNAAQYHPGSGAPVAPSPAPAARTDVTPQQSTAPDFSFGNHHHTSAAAAKVTPAEQQLEQKVRFASVSKRGRYTSPGRRATTNIEALGSSPAPSLCSAPSHDEPKKPAAATNYDVRVSLFIG